MAGDHTRMSWVPCRSSGSMLKSPVMRTVRAIAAVGYVFIVACSSQAGSTPDGRPATPDITLRSWPDLTVDGTCSTSCNGKCCSQGQGCYKGQCTTCAPVAAQVAKSDLVGFLTIAVDAAGKSHITYRDQASLLSYFSGTAGAWQASNAVDPSTLIGGDMGTAAARAGLDQNGKLRVAYFDNYQQLNYASNATGSWAKSALPAKAGTGMANLRVDGSGKSHILMSTSGETAVYMTNKSGSWTEVPIGSPIMNVVSVSLAVSSSGVAHAFYSGQNGPLLEVRYATNATGSWVTEPLSISAADYMPAGIDPGGKLHMVYSDTSGALHYASNVSGSWVSQSVDPATTRGFDIVIDAMGAPHIGYIDTAAGKVKYASRTGTTWKLQSLDSISTDLTSSVALAVGPNGAVHIVYGLGQLKYLSVCPYNP
jgi:hypothetical protein